MSTTAGGGDAGGSGMTYGDSTVAARLSIDIPTEGVQSLREITQEISRFRTEMEAAARSEGDFIGFFQTLPSIASQAANAYKTFADQLERSLAMQQRMQGAVGQWDVQPGSTPDNFKGMSAGMGRSDKDIGQIVADQDRMREMGAAGERQFMNIRSQRGALRPSDIPSSNSENDIAAANERISIRERVNQERSGGPGGGGGGDQSPGGGGLAGKMGQYGGIAKEIMNEFSAGRSGGVSGMLQRGISAAAGHFGGGGGGNNMGRPPHTSGSVPAPDSGTSGPVGADDAPGGGGAALSAIGRGLGGVGGMALGAAGLGLTAFQAAQFMGPRLQNLREMGMVEGGGIKEGAGQEIQARIMALNPFITNDQSRSIIQSALRDGYSGKEYETVTQFMKPQPMDEPVLTPQGWRTMKDILPGDYVVGSDGLPKLVLATQDKGVLDCYKVVFRDGSYARSSEDHLWATSKRSSKNFVPRTLKEISNDLYYESNGQYNYIHSVPLIDPVQFSRKDLPIDPYLLGLLLGDGNMTCSMGQEKVSLVCCEEEGYDIKTPFGCIASRSGDLYTFPSNWGFPNESGRGQPHHPLKYHLRALGLLGTNHKTKFIPREYLDSCIEDRISLLQGLIDTDGGIYKNKGGASCSVRFFNTNANLVEGVAELVRSLGGLAKVTWKDKPMPASWLKNGQKITPRSIMGTVSIFRLPDGVIPARTKRKAESYTGTINRRRSKNIVDIVADGSCEMKCILIESNDHLYVTRDYTLTHNSNLIDFGLSVQQSRDMIKKDMVLGGATPESLAAELELEKKQSKLGPNNRLSAPDRMAARAGLQGIMEDAGASSASAMSSSNMLTDMFSDDEALKGTAADGMGNMMSSQSGQAMALQLAGITPSSDYGEWGDQLAQAGPEAYDKILRWAAQQSGGKKGPFNSILGSVGIKMSMGQSNKLLQRLKGGKNEMARVQERAGLTQEVEERSSGEIAVASGSRTTALMGTLSDVVTGNWGNVPQRWRGDSWNEQEDHIPVLDKLVESQGGDPNKILVEDGSGGWNKLQAGNRDQLQALQQGGKWKRQGDEQGYTLAQTPSVMNSNFGRQNVEVGGSVQITVSAEPGTRVTSSPNVIKLTQNQMNANAAYSNYTMNSAPPGDR